MLKATNMDNSNEAGQQTATKNAILMNETEEIENKGGGNGLVYVGRFPSFLFSGQYGIEND